MKRSGYTGEQGRTEKNPALKESQIKSTMDDLENELAARKLVAPGEADFEPAFGPDGKIKSITVRDKKTKEIIFFSDQEFLRKYWGDKRFGN